MQFLLKTSNLFLHFAWLEMQPQRQQPGDAREEVAAIAEEQEERQGREQEQARAARDLHAGVRAVAGPVQAGAVAGPVPAGTVAGPVPAGAVAGPVPAGAVAGPVPAAAGAVAGPVQAGARLGPVQAGAVGQARAARVVAVPAGAVAGPVQAGAVAGPVQVRVGLNFDTGIGVGPDGLQVSLLGFGFNLGPRVGVRTPVVDAQCSVM
eukprot:Skav212744  [mRNA]  locus=scaffold955:38794:40765:+ [translate_table: standard]